VTAIAFVLMKATAILGLALMPGLLSAQEATSNRNANLRRDPSTASPIITMLEKGSRLTLVDDSPTGGFYHVRTEDDQVGWVFAKLLTPPTPALPSEALEGVSPGGPLEVWPSGVPTATHQCGLTSTTRPD
jgi:Bacterial SH3 domain